MSESPHLGLGYLAPSQAQKHVTVNEAFRRLDALVQLGVLDRGRTAPPSSPGEGDRHIVAAGATGAWAGHSGQVAAYFDGVWTFVAPKPGWLAYVAEEGQILAFVTGAWVSALGSLSTLEALTKLGVNATADLTNRLAVASDAVLFGHAGAGVQVKLNKASAVATASFLFQTGYSGRAEFGLAGSDGFSLKTSPDGSVWTSALTVDPATGAVDLPATQRIKVDKFTASGAWTKPAWASRVEIVLIGGGGGSGGLRGAGVAVAGGGGGSPGAVVHASLAAAQLPATVSVTIGAGGAGGTAQSASDANGVTGGAGGVTAFGLILRAITDNPESGGGGGTAAAGVGGVTAGYRNLPYCPNATGGAGSVSGGNAGGAGNGVQAGGGGGGGGITAANAATNGASAGSSALGTGFSLNAAGGSGVGSAGVAGTASATTAFLASGGSGGGGAGGVSVNGGQGGGGATPGGAGGAGGASRNGLSSGKGGDGARGEAWIVSIK